MFVSPMLLHKFTPPFDQLPFEEDRYYSQLKLDGFRMILSKFENKMKLYSRHNNELTSKFPELGNVKIPNGTVLDGEVVVTDSFGRPDFEETMSRFHAGKNGKQPIQYCVFDIIYWKGEKVTHLPLVERKAILESIIQPNETIALVPFIEGNGETFFNLTKEQGLEGIVIKEKNSKYEISKRSHSWLKVINYQFAEVYITGLRKDKFGVLLSLQEAEKVRPAGIMEFMTPEARKQLYHIHREFIIDESKDFIFLEPKIKAKVKYRNLTKENKLRISSFIEFIQ